MRLLFALVFLLGIGLAGFGVSMASQVFQADRAELNKLRKQSAQALKLGDVVIVKTKELRYGQTLRRKDVELVKWPLNTQPKNAFQSLEALFGDEGEEPRSILRTMERGEAILKTKVTEFGQDAGVSTRLSKGMRAFTLRVDVASGVSGFLQPGDRVDVFWTGRDRGAPITKLIIENVSLIAIDQIADVDRNRPIVARTVTVEVSPQRVAALTQAQNTGKLALSLRGAEDESLIGRLEVDQDALIGREKIVKKKVVVEKTCSVKVRKGADVVSIPTDCPE